MRKIVIIFLCLSICIFICINDIFKFHKTNIDLFNEILQVTDSKTLEYGVKVTFETDKDGQTVCNNLLNDIGMREDSKINVFNKGVTYCIEFDHNDVSGYIESAENGKQNSIVINIIKKDNKNELNDLKKVLENAVGVNNKNIKYFQYLKAKVPNTNLKETNNKVLKILKEDKAENIDTVPIESGYSTVAYTKQYETIKYNNKFMDINYSVCRYKSGNYIIIGTPIITTTY